MNAIQILNALDELWPYVKELDQEEYDIIDQFLGDYITYEEAVSLLEEYQDE